MATMKVMKNYYYDIHFKISVEKKVGNSRSHPFFWSLCVQVNVRHTIVTRHIKRGWRLLIKINSFWGFFFFRTCGESLLWMPCPLNLDVNFLQQSCICGTLSHDRHVESVHCCVTGNGWMDTMIMLTGRIMMVFICWDKTMSKSRQLNNEFTPSMPAAPSTSGFLLANVIAPSPDQHKVWTYESRKSIVKQ